MNNNLIVFVEGNIATGKTSFISNLTKLLSKIDTYKIKVYAAEKSSQSYTIYDLFCLNPEKWTAEYVIQNLSSKLEFLEKHLHDTNTILIIERSLHTESEVFLRSLYDCNMIHSLTYNICINLVQQISKILFQSQMNEQISYIYLRADPNDLFDNIMINNIFDSINFKLLKSIHDNYEMFLQKMQNTSSSTVIIYVDLPHDQVVRPSQTTVKNTFKQLQKHYPIFQNSISGF